MQMMKGCLMLHVYSFQNKFDVNTTMIMQNPLVHSFKTNRGHPFMTSTRRGRGRQAQVDASGWGRGQAPCGRPHRKLKIESTAVILSTSHGKEVGVFLPEFRLSAE